MNVSFQDNKVAKYQSMGEDNVPETKFELKIQLDDSANDAKPKIKRHTNETYRLTISYRLV